MSRIPTGGNFSPGIDHDNYSYAYFVYSDGDVYVDNGSWGVMGSYGRSSPDLAVYGYDVYYDGDVKYGSGVYLGGNSKKNALLALKIFGLVLCGPMEMFVVTIFMER